MENETPELNLQDEIKINLPKDYDIDFQRWMMANNYAIKTIKNYHKNIMNLILENGYLNIKIIKTFLGTNKDSLSKRAAVKLFILFLEDKYNIFVKEFRYPRLPKSTNALEVINKESFENICENLNPFNKMFAIVMYYGGLRVSEVAKIKTEDFNWAEWFKNKEDYGELKVTKSKRNKDRIIPYPSNIMQMVFNFADKTEENYLKKGILFNYRWGKRSNGKLKDSTFYIKKKMRKENLTQEKAERMYIDKVIKYFRANLAEISDSKLQKHVKTHMLRASRATHLDEKGMPSTSIQYLLGHDNLATTSRYIVNTPEKLKKTMKEIEKN